MLGYSCITSNIPAKINSDMTIHDWAEKIKSFAGTVAGKASAFYTLILLIVIASLFFALGRFSALEEEHSPIRVYNAGTASQTSSAVEATLTGTTTRTTDVSATTEIPASTASDGEVIGSKSGKKYYFPWCGTIKRVKPENQVVFASIADARAAGYLPAGNCKGLQ
jgi:hypothetical protein